MTMKREFRSRGTFKETLAGTIQLTCKVRLPSGKTPLQGHYSSMVFCLKTQFKKDFL